MVLLLTPLATGNYPVFSESQILINDWYGTSRLLASTLIRSRSESGNRIEIACVEDFRLGNRDWTAFDQSTYSVESWVSQNFRSSFSDLNLGMGLSFGFINFSLLWMHISGGYHPNFSSFSSQSERYVQQPSFIRFTEGVKSLFRVAVFFIMKHEQGFIKKTCSASVCVTPCFSLFRAFPVSQSKPSIT